MIEHRSLLDVLGTPATIEQHERAVVISETSPFPAPHPRLTSSLPRAQNHHLVPLVRRRMIEHRSLLDVLGTPATIDKHERAVVEPHAVEVLRELLHPRGLRVLAVFGPHLHFDGFLLPAALSVAIRIGPAGK
jgi:hypothetical protein